MIPVCAIKVTVEDSSQNGTGATSAQPDVRSRQSRYTDSCNSQHLAIVLGAGGKTLKLLRKHRCKQESNYKFTMHAAKQAAVNRWRKGRVSPEQMMVPGRKWATINYDSLDGSDVRGEVQWAVEKEGLAHGILLWFDTVLSEGVEFSNAPDQSELVYGNGFFPLYEPIDLSQDDIVSVKLQANLVGDDYVWSWQTMVVTGTGQEKADFKQSTFFGLPLTPERLRKRVADFEPQLNEEGRIDLAILQTMSSGASLGEIARQLSNRFPQRFGSGKDALERVRELSDRYG